MALKLLLLVLLAATTLYAVPTPEDDDDIDEMARYYGDEADEMDAEDAASTGKYKSFYNKKEFCVCKDFPKKSMMGDETERDVQPMSDDDFQDAIMELDPKHDSKSTAAKKNAKEITKLVSPFFSKKPRNLYCYCTKNKLVLGLFRAAYMYKMYSNLSYHYGLKIYHLKNALKKAAKLQG